MFVHLLELVAQAEELAADLEARLKGSSDESKRLCSLVHSSETNTLPTINVQDHEGDVLVDV